VVIEDRKI
jgi:hypothetical protein